VVSVEVLLSHYSQVELAGASIRWSTEFNARGTLQVGPVKPGSVISVGSVEFEAPLLEQAKPVRIYFELRLRNGSRAAENFLDVFVLPEHKVTTGANFELHDPSRTYPELPTKLEETGYRRSGGVLIATVLDDRVREHLAQGGDAIVLVDSALPEGTGISADLRAGNELDGRWFSNFNWVRWNQPPFDQLTFSRVLGFESTGVVPHYMLRGIAKEDFEDVLCGATFGWLQKNSAIVLQMASEGGRLLVTTFRFDKYGEDAYATALLHKLIDYVQSEACRPKLKLRESIQNVRTE
jgi:hypothetical protein